MRRLLIGISVAILVLAGYVLFPWPMPAATSFELVAHRGVHQTFPLTGLDNDTCTAEIIHPPSHTYIENTIPSIREAFAKGATAVEIDIHRTADGHLIVFHDWTLDCRTDGRGVTNEQTLAYLQSLDVGYGYTPDGGRTFPLRGTGVGMMPALPEVLAAFPAGRFVIDNKDGDAATRLILAAFLRGLSPRERERLIYWGGDDELLREQAPALPGYIFSRGEARACSVSYLLRMLLTGSLPDSCRGHIIGIPYRLLDALPGWPHLILARAHQAGARVYVADVDTAEQLAALRGLPLDGIQTNRIEVIGPLLAASPLHP